MEGFPTRSVADIDAPKFQNKVLEVQQHVELGKIEVRGGKYQACAGFEGDFQQLCPCTGGARAHAHKNVAVSKYARAQAACARMHTKSSAQAAAGRAKRQPPAAVPERSSPSQPAPQESGPQCGLCGTCQETPCKFAARLCARARGGRRQAHRQRTQTA